MLQYVIAGLVLGGIYAIAASGLVVTYLSAGVLNFSFASLAYAIARFYYYLNTQEHWSILPAAVLSIFVAGPALGVLLYFVLFRQLQLSSPLVKVVATIGLSVAVPGISTLIFGNATILKAPGLAPEPVRVFDFLNVPVTLDQVIVYGCVIVVVVAGALVLRYTDVGLRVRAMVDSPAMTSLSGTSPSAVSVGVWAASIGLAGLTGVLAAPIIGLDPGDFTFLMVAAFAAVIAAKLRNLPVAVAVGLGMGIAGALVQYYLPPSSSFTAAVLPSIPFAVTAIFLIYFMIRSRGVDESAGVGGALDRAITPQGEVHFAASSNAPVARALSWRAPVVAFAVVCVLPLVFQGFWVGLIGTGVCYGIIYLAYTLVTGEGGMIWLCMATFAGVGAMTMGVLATDHGWPVMAGVFVGGLVATPIGLLIGFLTIRLGDLYVALVTLTFGLLVENLVFTRAIFANSGLGITVLPPQFAGGPRAFAWTALGVFAVIAVLIVNLRRSTTGLALNAVRWSIPGSKTLGISVLQMKVLVAGFAAFVAGIGGAMLALSLGQALSVNYQTLLGLLWLATVVTLGIRSNMAALLAGMGGGLLGGVILNYLPSAWANALPVLFGLGAVSVVRFPDGVLAEQARQLRSLSRLWSGRRRGGRVTPSGPADPGPTGPAPRPAIRTDAIENGSLGDAVPDVGVAS